MAGETAPEADGDLLDHKNLDSQVSGGQQASIVEWLLTIFIVQILSHPEMSGGQQAKFVDVV